MGYRADVNVRFPSMYFYFMLVNQTATPELHLPVKKTTMKVTDPSQGLTQSTPSGVQNICHHATPIPIVKSLS